MSTMTTITAPQGGAVVITNYPKQPLANRGCRFATDILSTLVGLTCLILGIMTIKLIPDYPTPTGVIAGCIFLVTGIVGIAYNYRWHMLRGFYIFMGVSTTLVSAVCAIVLLVKLIWYAVTLDCNIQNVTNAVRKALGGEESSNPCQHQDTAVKLIGTQVVFCLIEFIVAIVGSCLACSCCCKDRAPNHQILMTAPPQHQQEHQVFMPQHPMAL